MELKDFVKESILQIVEGVVEARHALNDKKIDALINPLANSRGVFKPEENGYRQLQQLEFNVAVSVENKGDNKQGIGVITGLFSAASTVSESDINKNMSTLKFNIPLSLPPDSPDGE